MNTTVSMMTEKKPTYTYTYDDPDANVAAIIAATRREMTNRALDDAGAARDGISALMGEVDRLRDLVALGSLDDDALAVARHSLRVLRRRVEVLGVGL